MRLAKLQFFKMPIVALTFGVAIGLSSLASGEHALSKHLLGLAAGHTIDAEAAQSTL